MVLIDLQGNELRDLSGAAGDDDNDPDFLPDGRIVFKTNRFTRQDPLRTPYELRIAVMNDDGSNVVQVTSVDAVSDHDPVGDLAFAIFERFSRDTFYGSDPDAPFVSWPLVEARLDGLGERTVLDDGWVNWLPLYDPSGRYVAYLKSNGYTACYLMARDGSAQFGRLIPGITRISYLDWK